MPALKQGYLRAAFSSFLLVVWCAAARNIFQRLASQNLEKYIFYSDIKPWRAAFEIPDVARERGVHGEVRRPGRLGEGSCAQ